MAKMANILEDSDNNSADNDLLEEANILLITKNFLTSELFLAESWKAAVINTACTKTVAGEQWFNNFMSNLTKKSMKEIEYFPSSPKLNLVIVDK